MEKVKAGQIWKSRTSNKILKIANKATGNRHWNIKQLNGKNSHQIHEGTLLKYYEKIQNTK